MSISPTFFAVLTRSPSMTGRAVLDLDMISTKVIRE